MSGSRWKCPVCGTHDVEIALPAWFKEDSEWGLDATSGVDAEADILYWVCNAEECNATGQGKPTEVQS